MSENIWFYVGVHLLLTLIFLVMDLQLRPRLWAFAETMIVCFVPGFGLIILLLFKFWSRVLRLERGHSPELVDEGKAFFRGTKTADDVIPLNDAFLVENQQQKRRFFMDAIKQSVVENQSILQMAVHDRDREIAYYAVSMLTTQMEKLEKKLFEQETNVLTGHQPENLPMLETYVGLLKEYLAQKEFIDHVTWQKKQGDYIGILDRLTDLRPDHLEYYVEEIHQLLDIRNFRAAEQVCDAMKAAFPKHEETFLMYIELYQAQKRPEELQKKIRELKACPIDLSKQALQVIRFWDKEAAAHG